MRARLLNDGDYSGMPTEYPIEVNARWHNKDRSMAAISLDELVRIGANKSLFSGGDYLFFVGKHVEIIEDENQ